MAWERSHLACFATLPDGYGFEATLAAASKAGFTELAIWLLSLEAAAAELGSLQAVQDCLENYGLRVSVLELLHAWSGDEAALIAEERAVMQAFVDVFDPDVVLAAALVPTLSTSAVVSLRDHCRAFAPRRVALEFLPFTGVANLRKALALIAEVNADNLGLVFDAWHFARSEPDYDLLASVPAELFYFIQLNDAAVEPPADIFAETMGGRLRPGEGSLDWPALIEILTAAQPDCPVGSEQYSDLVKAMPLDDACVYLHDSVQNIIANPQYRPT
ncbi:MAG: sugar phosphate isomerase/epimerase [Pseudomonadota bacterium]